MELDDNVKQFIQTVHFHSNRERLNILRNYLDSDYSEAYRSVYSFITKLDSLNCSQINRNTKYEQIDRIINNAAFPEMFKKQGNKKYPDIPFKYHGIFYQLLIDSIDEKSSVSRFLRSHSPEMSTFINVYKRIYEIINKFKSRGTQVCEYQGEVVFSEPFFITEDATCLAAFQEIDKMNISEERKEFYKAAVYAPTSLYDGRIINASRNIGIDEDDEDLEIIEEISYMTAYNLEPSPYVFDDSEFKKITDNILRGHIGIIIDNYVENYKRYLELQFFVKADYYDDFINDYTKILSETEALSLKAKEIIKESLQKIKMENNGDPDSIQRKIRSLSASINQWKSVKTIFKECNEEVMSE